MKYRHLFGPVPSRRLGVSLGIDLVPHKTCTLDCVYCECGRTTNRTVERREYVPVKHVLEELEDYLAGNPRLDYITFAGSGEPTLNCGISEIIAFLKKYYGKYRVCLLTNGTLFFDPLLRKEVRACDVIIPSLDAATEEVFRKLNRPHGQLECSEVIEGLAALGREFKGELILEVFIVPGLNDTREEISDLGRAIGRIAPGRVQVGTLDRPGTEEWVEAAGYNKMKKIAAQLGGAELIGDFRTRQAAASFNSDHSSMIMQTLRRRPCTLKDLELIVNLHPAELNKYLNYLLEKKCITVEQQERGAFFKIARNPGDLP